MAYQQFLGEKSLLRDGAPQRFGGKQDDDVEEEYDKTLDAALYFYFPYYIRQQTQLMQANEFWPRYVFGLHAQCALLQSVPGA